MRRELRAARQRWTPTGAPHPPQPAPSAGASRVRREPSRGSDSPVGVWAPVWQEVHVVHVAQPASAHVQVHAAQHLQDQTVNLGSWRACGPQPCAGPASQHTAKQVQLAAFHSAAAHGAPPVPLATTLPLALAPAADGTHHWGGLGPRRLKLQALPLGNLQRHLERQELAVELCGRESRGTAHTAQTARRPPSHRTFRQREHDAACGRLRVAPLASSTLGPAHPRPSPPIPAGPCPAQHPPKLQ